MNKRAIIIFVIIAIISIVAGYFIYSKKAYGTKTMSIIQPKYEESSAAANEEVEAEIVTPEVVNESQKTANKEITEEKNETATKRKEEDKNIESKDNISVTNKYVSWGYQSASGRKINTIIIHSSYNALGGDPYNLDKLLAEYRQYGVAPHYLIDREGKIYQLVAEKNIAYHAGESVTPDGRTDVNDFSIGIEMMNKEDSQFTGDQYKALNDLLRYLRSKYQIKYVLGHNQIAPGRKTDPWNFDPALILDNEVRSMLMTD